MRRRSPSYSPSPRRGYGGYGRSPPRGRYNGRRDAPHGLLVRNLAKNSRPEELRVVFEHYGAIKDVYLPKDYYTGEPRGFGFVQFVDPLDAADAKRHMDRQIFNGREITVVFAEENRKRPDEMRVKERFRGRMGYGGRRRSPYRGGSRSLSPRYRSPSPRGSRYGRDRYESVSPPPGGRSRRSRSLDARRWEHGYSPRERSYASPPKDEHDISDGGHIGGSHYISPKRSYSPQQNNRQLRRVASPVAAYNDRRPRFKSERGSMSPPPQSASPLYPRALSSRRSRDSYEPHQRMYSRETAEERSLRRKSVSPGRSF